MIARILGRSQSLFAPDMAVTRQRLDQAIAGQRLLVVGAGGSVGAAFIKQVTRFRPAALHLVDLNENSLVELVRDLRASQTVVPEDFRTVSIDFGSEEFYRFAADNSPYHVLANFAAMKHVRSERDVYSLLRMITINVESLRRCLDRAEQLGIQRVFSVSTDKSVHPVNLMGATKNLMEKILFAQPDYRISTSARFANVAFSAGSLLESFEYRLAKGQPLAGPSDIERYFVSHEEAGELCLLACFLGKTREIFIPKMTAEADLRSVTDVAAAFLRYHGYEPHLCASEAEARARAVQPGKWPCYFAPTDTTGEKSVEEFYREDDTIDDERFATIRVVRGESTGAAMVDAFLADIERIRRSKQWTKEAVVDAVRRAVPEFMHNERRRDLDQKM